MENESLRKFFLEQLEAIRSELFALNHKMKTIPVAGTAMQPYMESIEVRIDACRGIFKAQDWE